MTDILSLAERAQNDIALGEGHYREFKSALEGPPGKKKPRRASAVCRDVGEALVAFANADGGAVLVGVEDDGTVTGVPHGDNDLALMADAPRTHVHPDHNIGATFHKLRLDGKLVLYFSVQKATSHFFQLPDGRCLRRHELSSLPATFEALVFERNEVRSREFDREFIDGATVSDLDLAVLLPVAHEYLPGISAERFLQQLGLAEYGLGSLRLRRAAVLLFASSVRRFHPRSEIRILRVDGTKLGTGEAYNVTTDETEEGNIATLLVRAWDRLRGHVAQRTEFSSDAKFGRRFLYPEKACREALVNALVHRSYLAQAAIEVFLFDDRMEVRSPGPLLSTVSIERLRTLDGVHESRNALIARCLREASYMRELGEGMGRIFEAMAESGLPAPELYSNGSSFSIVLRHGSTRLSDGTEASSTPLATGAVGRT